ncbi:hypothetical protein C8R46DRAFT_1294815 [Mycena filopes]|nr:hypothetical protein C8R46DRAFT_1294815 [Mycena filopes]
MPEIPESITSGTLPKVFINETPPSSRRVAAILADPTQAEAAAEPTGTRASAGHVYTLSSSSTICRGSAKSQTPVYPPLYSTKPTESSVPILDHGLVLVDAETHPRNVLLKFQDNKERTYWCQVQLLKHTVSQIYNKSDWDNAICVVDSSSRGFKVGIAFEFKDHVLAFLTLDLLVQFYWAEKRDQLPAQQPDVYLEFPRFLEDLVVWIERRRSVRSCRTGNAMTLVRTTTDIFAGAGVYTISEIWHMAGLSPNLTEAEVFDSPSRTARLCAAFFHFGKEAHTTLWALVKRFLVDYVICVRPDHRLLYSDRLHVYGKDRSYVTSRFNNLLSKFKATCDAHSNDEIWTREYNSCEGPFDVFEPDLRFNALENKELNLGSLIFGYKLWDDLHSSAELPANRLRSDNALSRFFSTAPIPTNMSATWLSPLAYTYLFHDDIKARRASHPRTLLYRASSSDIWSVIPAYPPNSAPIPRSKPGCSNSKKSPSTPTSSPTPMLESDSGTRAKALLNYIIQFTQDYTIGPLDYCGIARLIRGAGPDVIMYCKGDPRVKEFYHRRQALAEVTAKLRYRGEAKSGLPSKVMAGVNKKLARIAKIEVVDDGGKENDEEVVKEKSRGRKRHSADRDLAMSGLILSPRKKRRVVV